MDRLYDLHFAISALTFAVHFLKLAFKLATLLSISNPKIVNSDSHFKPSSGNKILSSGMSILVPRGIKEVLSRLHCNTLM